MFPFESICIKHPFIFLIWLILEARAEFKKYSFLFFCFKWEQENLLLKLTNLYQIIGRATPPPQILAGIKTNHSPSKNHWTTICHTVFLDLPTPPSDAKALMSPLKAFRIMTQFYTLFWWMMQERVEIIFTTHILSHMNVK